MSTLAVVTPEVQTSEVRSLQSDQLVEANPAPQTEEEVTVSAPFFEHWLS